jgi:hypothetical protein
VPIIVLILMAATVMIFLMAAPMMMITMTHDGDHD